MLEWYRANEPYETLMDDCAALLAEAARAAGATQFTFRGKTHRSLRRAGAADRGGGLRAPCRHRSAGDGRAAARATATQLAAAAAQGRRRDRGRRHLGRYLQPHSGRAGRAASGHRPRDHIYMSIRCRWRRWRAPSRAATRWPSASSSMPAAWSSPTAFGELTDAAEQRARFEAAMAEKAAHLRRALSARRGFPRRACADAAGLRHRARLRPAGDAGDRRAPHRAGDLDAGGRKREYDRGRRR